MDLEHNAHHLLLERSVSPADEAAPVLYLCQRQFTADHSAFSALQTRLRRRRPVARLVVEDLYGGPDEKPFDEVVGVAVPSSANAFGLKAAC